MISAKVIKKTYNAYTGTVLTTFEVVFPRWILAEVNTHKMISKNSASSRAVPIKSNIEYIRNNTAKPVVWGLNQAGMVSENVADIDTALKATTVWENARDSAIKHAEEMVDLNIHKQFANRLIENFSYQKAIITGTEWDNFFWLRNHKDAQPEFRELAETMMREYNATPAEPLWVGEWHLPYIDTKRDITNGGKLVYYSNGVELPLEDAIKVSASCCAQVSYRKADDSLEKAIQIFSKLNIDSPDVNARPHVSPTEHQGTPIKYPFYPSCTFNSTLNKIWFAIGKIKQKGITHIKQDGTLWSANFKDFVQYRHTINNESCKSHPNLIGFRL